MMHRRRARALRKAGLVVRVSDRALISLAAPVVSFDQLGTSPHLKVPSWRTGPPSVRRSATAYTSSVGATFQLGGRSSVRTSSTWKPSARMAADVVAV